MDNRYSGCIEKWNNIFSKESSIVSIKSSTGNEAFDKGIKWVCDDTEKILDFGCGNGSILCICALNGTKYNIGFDLSEKAIELAKKRVENMGMGEFRFNHGGVEELKSIENSSIDATIISNIIDNLYPDDAELLMDELQRILKDNGKILVKLNPYITAKQIDEWNISVIQDNLLDDGLILWNNTSDEWSKFFEKRFKIEHYEDIYYPEYEQHNRMFWLVK